MERNAQQIILHTEYRVTSPPLPFSCAGVKYQESGLGGTSNTFWKLSEPQGLNFEAQSSVPPIWTSTAKQVTLE